MAAKTSSTFSARDLGAVLNNAVAMAKMPATGEIPALRMRNLAAYALALTAPVKEDVDAELLRPEEAVFILASASLLVHAQFVQKTDKLPMLDEARDALTEAEAGK